jgi:hypothetical protein
MYLTTVTFLNIILTVNSNAVRINLVGGKCFTLNFAIFSSVSGGRDATVMQWVVD